MKFNAPLNSSYKTPVGSDPCKKPRSVKYGFFTTCLQPRTPGELAETGEKRRARWLRMASNGTKGGFRSTAFDNYPLLHSMRMHNSSTFLFSLYGISFVSVHMPALVSYLRTLIRTTRWFRNCRKCLLFLRRCSGRSKQLRANQTSSIL